MTNRTAVALMLASLAVAQPAAAEVGSARADRMNQGTVGIVAGGIAGTYLRIAGDLAAVLDDGENLRVVAMIGKGSLQNIADILYLKGVDIGIVQSDVLAYIRREGEFPGIERRISFITKLYNEEFHLLARDDVADVKDLAGKRVNFDTRGSGTFITATILFDGLGIPVQPTFFDQALALERLKSGDIAAMAYVAGKPASLFRDVGGDDKVKLLALPSSGRLMETYLPSRFTASDYPRLLPAGAEVDTIAVGAVMAVFNWDPGTARYQKVARFTEALFTRFDEFLKPPRHQKWQEVSLTAQVPGWKRFGPAEDWLRAAVGAGGDSRVRRDFDLFLAERAGDSAAPVERAQREAMFQDFLRWQSRRPRP